MPATGSPEGGTRAGDACQAGGPAGAASGRKPGPGHDLITAPASPVPRLRASGLMVEAFTPADAADADAYASPDRGPPKAT
jgi:hypothetical protein